MNQRKTLMLFLLTFISVGCFAQKIVFTDDYNTKNIGYDYYGAARIVEDSATGERVFIYSGRRELLFYQLDAKWKLIRKVKKSPVKESVFNNALVTVLKTVHNKDRWSFIVRSSSGCTMETIDFATEEFKVSNKFMEDINPKYASELFYNGNEMNILYLDKNNEINLLNFLGDLSPNKIKLSVSSSLPLGKKRRYSNEELFAQMTSVDDLKASLAYFTRSKVQFYAAPDGYSIVVAGEEPVVELIRLDKKTGNQVKSQLYELQDMLPEGSREGSFNSSAMLFKNKLHVLAANKSGGVYAVFEPGSKELLYHKLYSEKDNANSFNYGPVLYETMPGTLSTAVLKEKVDDISMDKFSTQLFKNPSGVTAKQLPDGSLLVTLANYEMKELTSVSSNSIVTRFKSMSSPGWYASASAGLIFEPGSWNLSAKKTTWNELNKSDAGDSYKRVEPGQNNDSDHEYNEKRAYILKTQYIGKKRYIIYLMRWQEIKINETILLKAIPKIEGVSE